jgi:hypothetical protein
MLDCSHARNSSVAIQGEVSIMFKKSISLVLVTLSMGGMASCSKKVEDKPVAGGAMTVGAVPAGITIDTDLQQELSTAKNHNNEKFTIKIKNGSIGKYPALQDATIEGHLENVIKAAKGKKAKLNLFFDDVKLKNGDLVPIAATLVNTKVESKTKGQFLKNAGVILGGAVAGHFVGDKTKFKHGKLAGAGLATAFVLSSPGGEVILKKGTDLQLKLDSNLDPN